MKLWTLKDAVLMCYLFDIIMLPCHVISPDFGGSSLFGAFPHGLTLGRRNLPTRGFSNVFFLGPYFSPNILSFTAVSTLRKNCLQLKCLIFIDLIDDHWCVSDSIGAIKINTCGQLNVPDMSQLSLYYHVSGQSSSLNDIASYFILMNIKRMVTW